MVAASFSAAPCLYRNAACSCRKIPGSPDANSLFRAREFHRTAVQPLESAWKLPLGPMAARGRGEKFPGPGNCPDYTCANRSGLRSKAGMISSAKVRKPGDRGARGGEQHVFDAARLQPLEPLDDLLRRAEQRRVVEFEIVGIVLDLVIALGAGAARQVADILQDLAPGQDGAPAFLVVVDDLQSARHPDHHRVVAAADRFAFLAEDAHPVDDHVYGRDLVEQQVVALARGAADRLGAAGAHPERRVRLLDRGGLDDDVVVAPPFSLVGEAALAGPRLADHVDRLVEPRGRLVLLDTEAGEFVGPVALADAEIEPAVRQQVERRGLLGDQHRVVPGQHDHRGAEADRRGARRQVGKQVQRGRDLAEPGEMVLDQEHARKAELLGGDHIADEIVVALAVAGRPAASPRSAEQSELHRSSP